MEAMKIRNLYNLEETIAAPLLKRIRSSYVTSSNDTSLQATSRPSVTSKATYLYINLSFYCIHFLKRSRTYQCIELRLLILFQFNTRLYRLHGDSSHTTLGILIGYNSILQFIDFLKSIQFVFDVQEFFDNYIYE